MVLVVRWREPRDQTKAIPYQDLEKLWSRRDIRPARKDAVEDAVRDRRPGRGNPRAQRGGSGPSPQTSSNHRQRRPQRIRLLGIRRCSSSLPIPGRATPRTRVPHPPPTQRHPRTRRRMPTHRPGKAVLRTRLHPIQTNNRGVDTPPTPPLLTHPPRRNRSLHHPPPSQKPTPGPTHTRHLHPARKRSNCRSHRHFRQTTLTTMNHPFQIYCCPPPVKADTDNRTKDCHLHLLGLQAGTMYQRPPGVLGSHL